MWNATNFIRTFRPRSVLDPTAGFGNRMVACCAAGVERYIGIDSNVELAPAYDGGLINFLSSRSPTRVTTFLQNDVEYSTLQYDCVFTSLPYYKLENYSHMKDYGTKTQWNKDFYRPLMERTYAGLERGGVYALNVPEAIYAECCIPVLGECSQRIPLVKKQRKAGKGGDYKEFVYVWRKSES